jgi:hypothetical protein
MEEEYASAEQLAAVSGSYKTGGMARTSDIERARVGGDGQMVSGLFRVFAGIWRRRRGGANALARTCLELS